MLPSLTVGLLTPAILRPLSSQSRKDIEMRRALLFLLFFLMIGPFVPIERSAQNQNPKPPETVYLLKPAHVFDGESSQLHDNWVVLVRGEKIAAVGPTNEVKAP